MRSPSRSPTNPYPGCRRIGCGHGRRLTGLLLCAPLGLLLHAPPSSAAPGRRARAAAAIAHDAEVHSAPPTQPATDAAPAAQHPVGQINDERDPVLLQRFDQRRAAMVEARHMGRTLAALGRQSKNPLQLLVAAQIYQQLPSSRRLVRFPEPGPVPLGPPPEPPRLTVRQAPEPADLLAEARAMILQLPTGAPLRDLLPLIDQVEGSEVVARGAVLGPQHECDGLSPGVRIVYKIMYEGGEKAVLALSADDGSLPAVRLSDEEGNILHQGRESSLVSWFPRWRGVFSVEMENHTRQRLSYCLETN